MAHEVCNQANDQQQLRPMAEATSAALGEGVVAVANAGYADAAHMVQCPQMMAVRRQTWSTRLQT